MLIVLFDLSVKYDIIYLLTNTIIAIFKQIKAIENFIIVYHNSKKKLLIIFYNK